MQKRFKPCKYLYFSLPFLLFAACTKKENIKSAFVKPEKRIIAFFGANSSVNRPAVIKLFKDTVYILDADITREAGEQMIIEQGTLIKAGVRDASNPGASNPAQGSLTIRPGGVLVANGTADEPIVFTSKCCNLPT